MSNPERIQIRPAVRLARVYEFPLDKYKQGGLTFEQRQAWADEQALVELRRKARLEANTPLPWHRRVSKWYDQNYEALFEGTGAAVAFVAGFWLLLTILVNLGRSLGWW